MNTTQPNAARMQQVEPVQSTRAGGIQMYKADLFVPAQCLQRTREAQGVTGQRSLGAVGKAIPGDAVLKTLPLLR